MGVMRSVGVRLRLYSEDYKRDAAQAVKANENLGKSGQKAKHDLDGLATGMTILGGALTALAVGAVYATAKFDKQMSEVKAVSGASTEEFGKLRQAALDAGAATVFSATEAAEAESELAKAGVLTADILGGGLTGALSLASAGTLDLATAATISAGAMNTFGLKGKDVEHIADVLAAASNKSAASVEDLGLGLQQVGLVANQVGFSLEETVGLLAAFADRGLRGSDGATSLKTALLRLAAPEREAAAALKQYNISLYDANGQMVDAATIAGQLQQGLGSLSDSQRNAALSTIFGSDAIRAANILYTLGEDGIRDYIDAVNDEGAAARVAAEKMNNLSGDVEELTGSLETLFITSSQGASEGLRFVVQMLDHLVNGFAKLPSFVQQSTVILLGLTGAALLMGAALIKARTTITTVSAELAAMGATGAVAATGLRLVTTAAGAVGVALTVASIAMEIFGKDSEGVAKANRVVTRAAVELAEKNIDLGGSFGEAANQVDGLVKAFNELNGKTLAWRDAERDVEAAVDDLTDALKASHGSLDVTTEKGRAASEAVDDLAKKAIEAAQARYNETHSIQDAFAVYQKYIDILRGVLKSAGLADDKIDDLIGSIANMPAFKELMIAVNFVPASHPGNVPGGMQVFKRWGGIEHAATGTVRRQAQVARRPMVWWSEPETGGEAYVPKRGNYGRSMGILREAAGWYGADVVPRGGWGSAGSSAVEVRISFAPGADGKFARAVADGLRFDTVQVGAGNVQTRYGSRGRQS